MRTSDKNKLTNQILLGLLAASIGLGGMEYVSADAGHPARAGRHGRHDAEDNDARASHQ